MHTLHYRMPFKGDIIDILIANRTLVLRLTILLLSMNSKQPSNNYMVGQFEWKNACRSGTFESRDINVHGS